MLLFSIYFSIISIFAINTTLSDIAFSFVILASYTTSVPVPLLPKRSRVYGMVIISIIILKTTSLISLSKGQRQVNGSVESACHRT